MAAMKRCIYNYGIHKLRYSRRRCWRETICAENSGDYFNAKYMEAAKDRFRTVQDFFPLFVDKPLEFEPGARVRYSNAGFIVQ